MIQSKDYDGRICTLVNVKTGLPIENGAVVMLDGKPVTVTGGRAPHKSSSTGRVWVQVGKPGCEREFFPGVIDAQWMPSAITLPDDTQFMPL
jgi:hypothetical protein